MHSSFDLLSKKISSEIREIPPGNVPLHLAEQLSLKFNSLRADIAAEQLRLRSMKADQETLVKVAKKNSLESVEGKNQEVRKARADADPDYMTNVKGYDRLDAKIKYLDTMLGLCEDYHVYFRMISK